MDNNRARAPSRVIRGRGRRGVNAYRPYFFFRRNGRTIPVLTRGAGANATRVRRNGAQTNTNNAMPNRLNNVPAGLPPTDLPTTFVRPQVFAAPEDAQQQTQSIKVEVPVTHPGWRLYFYKESLEEAKELVKHISYMETHFKAHAANYDFHDIQKNGFFELKASIIQQDEALKENWPTLIDDLASSPLKTLAVIGLAMHSLATLATLQMCLTLPPCTEMRYVPKVIKPRKIYVRPTGFIAEGAIANISSLEIDQLYCVRGRVKEVGPIDASVSWLAFRCSRCSQEQAVKQTDSEIIRPTDCKREGCLAKQGFIEIRSSPFTRITPKQTIRLTDSHLDVLYDDDQDNNRSIDVELKYDLVDLASLGQEILLTGALKMRPLQNEQFYDRNTNERRTTDIYLKAVSIVDGRYCKYKFTPKDMDAITMINSEPDSFKLLVNSLAPEVHGHEVVKAGALLSLISGAGSQVHEEEEINVLLVGDPGVGKSKIIQQCSKISLKGSLVQAKRGNVSSATILTHSVKSRSKLSLVSGGLLNAAYGHCCIDDIDRLGSQQESLISIMQSRLSCLTLSALCSHMYTPTSIIATANTVSGHYDQSKLLTENIRISPSLLREFHLVFLMLDKPNKEMDTSLTEHVKALHSGRKKNSAIASKFEVKPKTDNSMNMSVDNNDNDMDVDIDDNYNIGSRLKLNPMEETEMALLPTILIKKFIAYSRQQVKPLLVADAAAELKKFYLELRQQSANTHNSVSSGHLAGLIRLCQARARIDFSTEVTKLHVRDVISMVKQSNSDIAIGDYVDTNPSTSSGGRGNVKKFIKMLEMRSSALSRRIFEFDELKDMARRVGIHCGVTNLIDIVNLQGILLKKGPNMYEYVMD